MMQLGLGGKVSFLDESGNQISTPISLGYNGSYDGIITIPINAKTIYITCLGKMNLYEIQTSNEPILSMANGYMLLTADPTKAIKSPYQMVTISYFATSVQRLYQIGGTEGQWLTYKDQPIKVDQGQTIYAKGIDQYGNETRIISSYTVNVPDAIGSQAYDGDDSTYAVVSNGSKMQIDNSMQGKNIKIHIFKLNDATGAWRKSFISR